MDTGLSFTSPLGLGTFGFGALPKTVQKAASIGFASQMLSQAPEQARALLEEENKPEGQRNVQKMTEDYLGVLSSLGFGTTTAAHGALPELPDEPVNNPVTTDSQAPTSSKPAESAPVEQKIDDLADQVKDLQAILRGKLPAAGNDGEQPTASSETAPTPTPPPDAPANEAPTPAVLADLQSILRGNQGDALSKPQDGSALADTAVNTDASNNRAPGDADSGSGSGDETKELPASISRASGEPEANGPVAGNPKQESTGKGETVKQTRATPEEKPNPSQAELEEQHALETVQRAIGLNKVQSARLAELQAKNNLADGQTPQAAPNPSGEGNGLTTEQAQQSIQEAIDEKHKKYSAAYSSSPTARWWLGMVRRRAESAFESLHKRSPQLFENAAFDPKFGETEVGLKKGSN